VIKAPILPPFATPNLPLALDEVRLDAINSTVYYYPDGSFPRARAMALAGDRVFLIDEGQLKKLDLRQGGAFRKVQPENNLVEGVPVKELGDLTLSDDGRFLYLLDRAGDIYRYGLADESWSLERSASQDVGASPQYPVALSSSKGYLFILDTYENKIWWRQEGKEGQMPRSVISGAYELKGDGDLYLLVREKGNQGTQVTRVLSPPDGGQSQALVQGQPGRFYALFVEAGKGGSLYAVDVNNRYVFQFSKETGKRLRLYSLADITDRIRAVAAREGRLYVLGRDRLYVYPPDPSLPPPATVKLQVGSGPSRPDDLAVLSKLEGFISPIRGTGLADQDFLLPGAARPYRHGVHEGVDYYWSTSGVPLTARSEVLAAKEGVVIRADTDYRNPKASELYRLLDISQRAGYTSPDALDELRGMQVWIDHGGEVVTRYAHLSAIASGVKAGVRVSQGEVIGYVGNSGTADSLSGPSVGAHLHFEIRLGEGYLGQYLSPIEVRSWLERVLQVK